MKLTNTQVKALEQGKESGDGRNLWLVSNPRGRKRWEFRYTVGGRRHFMGLGPWPDVSLDDARDKAFELRRALRQGLNPLAEKQAYKPGRLTTFKEVAEDAISRFAKAWTGRKQEPQWRASLENYA